MHDPLNLKGYQSILCLNGDLPDTSFFLTMELPIIAADGAANRLFELGIPPKLIVGDLDSVRPEILTLNSFLQESDQNSNDFQKTMRYLKEKKLLPAIIVGINGGFLDHILNNINIFMETNCLLYAPPIRGFVIREKSRIACSLPILTKISLMGIPEAILSSTGLKWELNSSRLAFPGNTSCFNRTQVPEIILEAHHGEALVLVYEQQVSDAGGSNQLE